MICVQALLDMYTIQQEVGHLDNLKIALVGDLANGRTVRSLAYLLSMYNGVKMYFVAPDVVCMKDDIKEFLTGRQALLYTAFTPLMGIFLLHDDVSLCCVYHQLEPVLLSQLHMLKAGLASIISLCRYCFVRASCPWSTPQLSWRHARG